MSKLSSSFSGSLNSMRAAMQRTWPAAFGPPSHPASISSEAKDARGKRRESLTSREALSITAGQQVAVKVLHPACQPGSSAFDQAAAGVLSAVPPCF